MRDSRVQLVVSSAATIAGVAAILLPFTYSTSPLSATFDRELWQLAVPFYLALPIGLAWLAVARSGSLSAGLRMAGWIAAAAGAATTTQLLLWGVLRETPSQPGDWLGLATSLAVLAGGGALVLARRRAGGSSAVVPAMAMQVAYLANASFCLITFAGEWQSGAWCAAAAALIYVIQIASEMKQKDVPAPVTRSRAATA